eukprot:6798572-Pyramimonas_sp.AAC.1
MPFIQAGDSNLSPEELSGSGWVQALSGHILAPTFNACASGHGRVLDYYVVSEGLQYGHQLTVLTD